MIHQPLRVRLNRRRRLRWEAASRVIDDCVRQPEAGARPGAGAAPEASATRLDAELASMRGIADVLSRMPQQAWENALGPAPAPSPALARGAGGVERAPARRRPVTRAGLGLVAAAALAVAFLVGSLTHPLGGGRAPTRPASGTHVVLRPVTGSGGHGLAVAYMLGGGGRMLLAIRSLPRSRPGTYYELWLMTSTTDLVPVSSFRVGAGGSGVLNLILPDDPGRYRYLDISVQRVGAGQAISSESVLRGAIPA